MKKSILFPLGFVTMLCACTQKPNSLIGTWTVDKVNVQFDEQRSTPELVKQIGEMEKQNVILISPDSMLIFNSLEGETKGKLSLSKDGTLTCNGNFFGIWKGENIVTRTNSPLGEIVVTYRKK